MGTGFSKKKKQARAMQQQFMDMQGKLNDLEVVGTAGNGLVTMTLNGEGQIKRLKIKPECVDPDDIEGLEDLIVSAHKEAQEKLKKESSLGLPTLPEGFPDLGSLTKGFPF